MKTSYQKIIRRDDGSRVKISVSLYELYRGRAVYGEEVETCAKGKRTWRPSYNRDDYKYRGLSMGERKLHVLACNRKIATEAEILAVKIELWESLKPTV